MKLLLAPIGLLYGLVNRVRRRLYDVGFFRAQRLPKPVISVGNLTVGGTGKTPFVEVLLTQLEGQGLKCCVLTRGYGRKSSQSLLVSNTTTTADVGDEPLWLFRRHPLAKIAVGADRMAASKLVDDVDVFILDDGLQHLQIHRDFEITLIDATRPLSHYLPLPWGFGREGFEVLKRADLVVLTRANQASPEQLDQIAEVIFKNGVLDLIEAAIEVDQIKDVRSGDPHNLLNLKVGLVSAIGNPDSFETLAKDSSWNFIFHEKKGDHWNFTASDITNLEKKALAQSAQALVTTEKDAVKIQNLLSGKGTSPARNLETGSGKWPGTWVCASIKMTFDPELPNIYDLVSHSSH